MNVDFAQAALGAAALSVALATAWALSRRRIHSSQPRAAPDTSADLDPVTGLMTRTRFELALLDRLLLAEKQGMNCCVLHIGLDGFRLVRDDGGAVLANKVLTAVAARLRLLGGASMALARVAGDEFAMSLNAPREVGEKLALRITQAFAAPLQVDGRDFELSVSVGLATAPEHDAGPRLLGKAAAVTHAVQRSGGGAHAVFDPRIEAANNEELSIARELRAALGKSQLEVFFQPKIDATRIEVSAVEALVRWRHPSMGLVSPARFIPIAERQGLLEPLGQWVLEGALKQVAAWRSAGMNLHVAVNISGGQFRSDDFATKLQRCLKAHGLPADWLTCEITEAVAVENTEATRRAFARLHKVGVQIAIGDFAGHATSLSALASLQVHEIKVARSLVAAVPNDAEAGATIARVVAAAQPLGLRMVAEGVENEAQRDAVVRLGCNTLQGYLFAKPMSARAVGLWAVDASRNLEYAFRSSQVKHTQAHQAFAETRISLGR
jgi:diguanylate cyclase (GGDEF)-like protein